MPKYYPLMFNLADRKIVIIGGGKVAYRKVTGFLEYNPEITVISLDLYPSLEDLVNSSSRITWVYLMRLS